MQLKKWVQWHQHRPQQGCSRVSMPRAARSPMHICSSNVSDGILDYPSRRGVLSTLVLLPAILGGAAPSRAVDSNQTTQAGADDAEEAEDFFTRWPYAGPADIIPYIQSRAQQGDAQAILDAMDAFGEHYPMYKIGAEKGGILEGLIAAAAPQRVLEIGTFLGYSAIRIARQLPAGGRLLCIEANPDNAAVARQLVAMAGLGPRVSVLEGRSGDMLPSALQQLCGAADVVFEDHCKQCYLPDLQAMEDLGVVVPGTVVVADNVVYPGAPGFLEYVDSGVGRYSTRLIPAAYEYEQVWNPMWEHHEDALSVSTYRGEPQPAEGEQA